MDVTSSWGVDCHWGEKVLYFCFADEVSPEGMIEEPVEIIPAIKEWEDRTLTFSPSPYMCGPNCLALLCYALKKPAAPERIAEIAGTDSDSGTSMLRLAEAAQSLGLKAKGVRIDKARLRDIKGPLIIHVDVPPKHFHYLVYERSNDDGTCTVIDPPEVRHVSQERLAEWFTGYALAVSN